MKARHRHEIVGFKLIAAIILLMFSANIAFALPSGPQVANGRVSFSTQGNNLTVTNSPNSIINWLSFSIGGNEAVRFMQQSSASAVLNRITGQSPSQIFGLLQSNGRVFLVNPNGILFGQGSQINVAGLVASTLNIIDQDFLAGKYNFSAGALAGSIQHQGTITTPSGGSVYLIAPNIENSGIINSPQGTVLLAAGHSVQLVDSSSPDIAVVVSAPDDQAVNLGQIIAQSGTVGIYGALISQKGIVSADSATVGENGKIIFKASQSVTLDAGSVTSAQGGGTISVLADMQNGTVNVAGTLDASAPNGGNGGFIETSAAKVNIADSAHVTTLAPYGKAGTWLIDPYTYNIGAVEAENIGSALSSTDVTIDTNGASPVCTGTTCTGTTTDTAGDINVDYPISWLANTTLTLAAYHNINVNSDITATGNTAGLKLYYGRSNSDTSPAEGTAFALNSGAKITLSGANPTLYIGKTQYTVINSVGAQGDVNQSIPSSLQGIASTFSGNYALGSDINASATSGWNSLAGFVPIGSDGSPFTGIFDGFNHTINSLYIHNSTLPKVGLFGISSGTIKNVGLTSVNVNSSGSNAYIGGLVGYNDGTITNSYSTGTVSGVVSGAYVGGLVGNNHGTISNTYNAATVTVNGDSNRVGGLVGYNDGTIRYSTNNSTGTVTVTSSTSDGNYVGGLVGQNDSNGYIDGYYSGSSNAGAVYMYGVSSITNNFVGGLVGGNNGAIGSTALCNNSGAVTVAGTAGVSSPANNNYVGGLVGLNNGTIGSSTVSCSNSGTVTVTGDSNSVGGLAGSNESGATINSSANAANVYMYGLGNNANYVGGLAGKNSGTIGNLGSTSNSGMITVSGGGNGDTNTEVGGLVGYNGGSIASSYNTVAGTVYVNGMYMDVGGLVGNNSNTGSINGSYSTAGAVTGTSSYSNVGGLVGYNDGTINSSYSTTGTVTGTAVYSNVGGLVGYNYGTGSGNISNSYSTSTVIGGANSYVGGLVGYNDNIISSSYSTGTVTGGTGSRVGGLVGFNTESGNISTSYSAGLVTGSIESSVGGLVGFNYGSIGNSYWDTTTSGLSNGVGNSSNNNVTGNWQGLTDSQMTDFSQFVGWNVFPGLNNDHIWNINPGTSYPYLSWQRTSNIPVPPAPPAAAPTTPPPPPTTTPPPPPTTPPPPPTTTPPPPVTTTTPPPPAITTTSPTIIVASTSATTNVVSTTQTATSMVTVTPTLPITSNQSATAALLESPSTTGTQGPALTGTPVSLTTASSDTTGSSTTIASSSATGGGSSSSDTTSSSGSSGSDKGKQDKGGTTSDKGKNDQKPKKNFCN